MKTISPFRPKFTAGIITLMIALSGCYNDPKNLDKAVAEKSVPTSIPQTSPMPSATSPASTGDITASSDKKGDANKGEKDPKKETKIPTADDLGLPFYPDAKVSRNADGSPRSLADFDAAKMVELETSDSTTAVDSFYLKALPGAMRDASKQGNVAYFRYLQDGSDKKSRAVEIHSDGKLTHIALTSIEVTTIEKQKDATPPTSTPPHGSMPPLSGKPK